MQFQKSAVNQVQSDASMISLITSNYNYYNGDVLICVIRVLLIQLFSSSKKYYKGFST